MRTNPPKKVRFLKPPNLFKQKIGSGGIDEKRLEKAQEIISDNDIDFIPYAAEFLSELNKLAQEAKQSLKNGEKDAFEIARERMIAPVMQLKANGGMFRYQLVSDVADIALQFLEAVDIANEDAFDVIRAHENTIKVIITNKLKGDGGREGYALIKELDNACQRYFNKYGEDAKQPAGI